MMELTDYEYFTATCADIITERVSLQAVSDLSEMTNTIEEFFHGIQATIHLQDVVEDHYEGGIL